VADELKPMLSKVLASGGQKKFFFAYGLGRRKDGKGDGELAVGGKKPKKADLEHVLTDCKQVLEGICWTGNGPEDGETVYFQGKSAKLTVSLVSKMALTAKRMVGRQYDFQIPCEEEELRAAALSLGESDREAATDADAPPSTDATVGADLAAEWKTKLALWSPEIKEAMAAMGSNAQAMAKLLAQAMALSKPGGDVTLAVVKLTECHALAVSPGDNGKASEPTDLEAQYNARVKALTEALKKAITSGTDAGNEAKLRFGESQLFSRKRDFGQALALLKVVEEQIKKALMGAAANASGASHQETKIPTGMVAAAVLRSELQTLRLNAARRLEQLAGILRSKTDPRAQQIQSIVKQLALGLPSELERVLEQLDASVQADDSATAQAHRAAIQEKAKQWLAFLQSNAHEIRCCEQNPWGVAVAVDQPVRAALTAILKTTR
jgi:hypothetical protein